MPRPEKIDGGRLAWIMHFRDMHNRREDPGPDDMMNHAQAFIKVYNEHAEVHKHFYVGHEHGSDGKIIYGTRTK